MNIKIPKPTLVKASYAKRVWAQGEALLEIFSKINFSYPNYLCFISYVRGRSDNCRPMVSDPFDWKKGTKNLADYFTKHFTPKQHQRIRYVYLQHANSQISCQHKTQVRGCVPSSASQAIIHSRLTARVRHP